MSMHHFMTIRQLRELLEKKEITREEILEFYLKRFESFDESIGSSLEIFDKVSIIENSSAGHELSGIPGLIKDNICQTGRITSCASKILENFISPYDATVIERLKQAGAFLIGRANMDEFAMGSSTETSAFKKTKNPWNHDCVPGGSSGGSAAAVAAGLVPWALGSDTGGSISQPAGLCGVVGIKPTYGLVSRHGLVAYGSSVDQIGVFAKTVWDNAKVLSVIAGKDNKDASMQQSVIKNDYTVNLDGGLPANLRIGVVENALGAQGVEKDIVNAIESAIDLFNKEGAYIKRMTLPILDYAAATYFILSRAEAASNLARFDGVRYGLRNKKAHTLAQMYSMTRHDGFGDEVRARILVGNYVISSGHSDQFYNNAKKVQRLISHEFTQAFKDVDILIMPTHPAPAFKFGAFNDDKLQMDLQDYFTCAMNLAGIPALSLPCGMSSNNLPIGFQIVGPHLSEELLYRIGHAYQEKTEWHKMYPERL